MKRLVTTLLFALLCAVTFAQSAALMAIVHEELDKRGLEETKVRSRLLENGIDVDNIPRAEYPRYQARVLAILDQMEAEAKGEISTETGENVQPISVNEIPQTTQGEEEAEAAIQEQLEDVEAPQEVVEIYGHSLFAGTSMDIFRTTDGAQAPDNYVLGEGDEIHISIFGSSQTEIHQRIGPDGSIQPNGTAKIFLKGLTLAQGRKAIKKKLAQYYSFHEDQIAVTISTARTLTVSIYGEVGVQGGFTISALNTAFNALAAAGGPTDIGSLRNIQRSRAGKVTRLDLYQFMTGKLPGEEYNLQNNDVLFVPVAEKVVAIEGAVNRPMRYEIVDGETLTELIRYAGGLKTGAYTQFVQIERFAVTGEKELLEFDHLDLIAGGKKKVPLYAGDIVRVTQANDEIENFVRISGDVYYPGDFNLEKNSSLKALLDNAQPRKTAQRNYVYVERTREDESVQILTVPFPGTNGNPDFQLQGRDKVFVVEQAFYRDLAELSVQGQVRAPFTRTMGLYDQISVQQAIDMAGGLKPSVYPIAYIFRQDLTNLSKMSYIPVTLETDGEIMLQAGDELRVYDNSTFANPGEVRVSGAVKNSTGVTYDATLTVRDLIVMAGGLALEADPTRVEVFRLDIGGKVAKLTNIPIQLDEDFHTTEPFQLQPFDHVVVRMKPNLGTDRVVEVNGRVQYPGIYVLPDGKAQLSQVISMAGGLMEDASTYSRVFRTYKNRGSIGLNLKDLAAHPGDEKYDPILMAGDVINIDREENTVIIRSTGTRMSQFVAEDYSLDEKLLVYQGPHDARWYIKHYAGGFHKYADRNSVTVTMPNNQSESTKHFLFFRIYPKVEPGSVITLSMDYQRKEKAEEPKEKINWAQLASSSLSVLTSIVSMILLVERLN